MRYRQIHLDFHTAPVITDTGVDFDPEDFVNTLKESKVNSINIFAKCHHGMCYYPTKVGRMHPALSYDLLGSMISVLHKNDISCPIYFPLGWEEEAANHTDWLEVGDNNVPGGKAPDEAGYYTWRKLCLNNPDYRKYMKAQLTELLNSYEVDGFWFDIVVQNRCHCAFCKNEMLSMGLSPENVTDLKVHDDYALNRLQDDLNQFVHDIKPDVKIVYNTSWAPDGGYSSHTIESRAEKQDHVELESLPSGEWGYNHFPLFANFYNKNDSEYVGMNGKFHLSWGDHGSLKNDEALEYECFRMIANGAASSVGDQLHPRGRMNKSAYKRIGKVYSVIEALEPCLKDTKKCSDIGVVVSADFFEKDSISDEGAMRMLMELHYTFDFITVKDELSKYKLIILPDSVVINPEFSKALKEYVDKGGKVLATAKSTDADSLGISYLGDNEYTPSYILVTDKVNEILASAMDPLEYVCYEQGVYVQSALPVVAKIGDPYFNRTADCFSSHRHFPFNKESEYPAILLSDNIGYCAFPLFKDYMANGNRIFREIISALIKKLMPEPILEISAPTCAEITVRKRDNELFVHVLSYIAERRTRTIDIVDTKLPLRNISFSVNLPKDFKEPEEITAVRSGINIPFTINGGKLAATIPEIDGYEIIRLN